MNEGLSLDYTIQTIITLAGPYKYSETLKFCFISIFLVFYKVTCNVSFLHTVQSKIDDTKYFNFSFCPYCVKFVCICVSLLLSYTFVITLNKYIRFSFFLMFFSRVAVVVVAAAHPIVHPLSFPSSFLLRRSSLSFAILVSMYITSKSSWFLVTTVLSRMLWIVYVRHHFGKSFLVLIYYFLSFSQKEK